MRAAWWMILLLVPLSGCFDFLEPAGPAEPAAVRAEVMDDPASYTVSGVAVWPRDAQDDYRIESADGTELSVKIYEPITRDVRPDRSPIEFPVIILVHPWGYAKEYFENAPMGEPTPDNPDPRANIMQMFAQEGFITVAYDVRGWGRSDGEVQAASAADMADVEAIRQVVAAGGPPELNLATNGFVGMAGPSLGGGTSLRAFATNPEIDAVASIYGWSDLYEAIAPGNVPKSAWTTSLFATGQAQSGGRLSDEIESWLPKAVQRVDLASVESAMDVRSTRQLLSQVEKPAFFCQGNQETLFPQIDRLWETAGGFSRSVVTAGGHGVQSVECWQHTLDWMNYFLRGVDNNVPSWPFLQSIDALPPGPALEFTKAQLANVELAQYYFHENALVQGPSARTFTIAQRVIDSPVDEAGVVADSLGAQAIPEDARRDPSAVFFDSGVLASSTLILGRPAVHMELASEDAGADFQIIASLFVVIDGDSTVLSRGSYSHKAGVTDAIDRTFSFDMGWAKATVPADARFVLKLGANDNGQYMPFPDNFEVDFTGQSGLVLPIFA